MPNRKTNRHSMREEVKKEMPSDILGTPLFREYKKLPIKIDDPSILNQLNEWELLSFRIEKPNSIDNKPVSVRLCRRFNGEVVNDRIIGYMADDVIRDMVRDFISNNRIMLGRISNIDFVNSIAYIHIAFYMRTNLSPRPVYRLVYNAGIDMQNNIAKCKVGDDVIIEHCPDDRWLAICNGNTIGYFPKHATYNVQDSPPVSIEKIEKDGNSKYTVYVMCYLGAE